MNRRDFIANMSLLTSLSLVPKMAWALESDSKTTYQQFKKALSSQPQLIGYQNYTQERVVDNLKVEGQFPQGFKGSLFRNGPALFERDEVRYEHLFEGDGMIHAFTFDQGKVSYKNKFVQTEKHRAEQLAQRFLYDFSGIGIKNPKPISSADTINPANTNILPVGDELWALWEAGSAHSLNPETLETKGTVTLDSDLKGMPFSAHPKVEADGTIWNFGLDYSSGKLIMYRLKPSGQLHGFGVIDTGYHAMLHDFLVTEKHILVILPSLAINQEAKSFMQQQTFMPEQPMRVLVIDKNDFKVKSSHEFPPCFIFHFGNAWEDADGSIHFDGCRYPDLKIMKVIEQAMAGKTSNNEHSYSQSTLFTIRSNGQTSQQIYDGISEFPRISPSMTGLKNKKVFSIGGDKDQEWMQSVRSLNIDTGKVDSYDYGSDYLVEEHIVVENGHRLEKNGYLLGTALHWPSKKSCVSLFEADNLSAGPIAKAWLPFHIPLGFHGNFSKAV